MTEHKGKETLAQLVSGLENAPSHYRPLLIVAEEIAEYTEALEAENARLREALEEIATSNSDYTLNPHSNEGRVLTTCMDIAREALASTEKEEKK